MLAHIWGVLSCFFFRVALYFFDLFFWFCGGPFMEKGFPKPRTAGVLFVRRIPLPAPPLFPLLAPRLFVVLTNNITRMKNGEKLKGFANSKSRTSIPCF